MTSLRCSQPRCVTAAVILPRRSHMPPAQHAQTAQPSSHRRSRAGALRSARRARSHAAAAALAPASGRPHGRRSQLLRFWRKPAAHLRRCGPSHAAARRAAVQRANPRRSPLTRSAAASPRMRAADLATPGPLKHAYQLFNASKTVRVAPRWRCGCRCARVRCARGLPSDCVPRLRPQGQVGKLDSRGFSRAFRLNDDVTLRRLLKLWDRDAVRKRPCAPPRSTAAFPAAPALTRRTRRTAR